MPSVRDGPAALGLRRKREPSAWSTRWRGLLIGAGRNSHLGGLAELNEIALHGAPSGTAHRRGQDPARGGTSESDYNAPASRTEVALRARPRVLGHAPGGERRAADRRDRTDSHGWEIILWSGAGRQRRALARADGGHEAAPATRAMTLFLGSDDETAARAVGRDLWPAVVSHIAAPEPTTRATPSLLRQQLRYRRAAPM